MTATADRLLALPWELLRLDGRYPIEDHTLDLAREAVRDGLPGLAETSEPLRIVATVAAPAGAVELDYEGEMYRLWQALGARDEGRLVVPDLGTVEDLASAVAEHRPSAVHFTGHGRPGELLFEDEALRAKPVAVEELVRKLRDAGELPSLIYLAACHGASVGPAAGVTAGGAVRDGERMVDVAAVETAPSTAAALHRAGFAQVVAYFGPVGDLQATRTAAAFYGALAAGSTARAALRRAREVAAEPLADSNGQLRALYPLGWAQLALYHRGADLPTAAGVTAPPVEMPRKRLFGRIDLAGGSERVEGIVGVQQLHFGFIGRRGPRGEALQRWRAGRRVLVVEGLGGLGKTALCGELLRLFGRDRKVLALDGRYAGAQPRPLAALWQEVEAARGGDDEWTAVLAALQREGFGGAELARAVALLAEREGGLVVYLDDAESLQEEPAPGARLGRWRSEELRRLWLDLVASAVDGGHLALVASSRYRPEGTPEEALLNLPPMSHWEIVRLLTWMLTLRRLPAEDRSWIAERVDGHPRTVEYLEVLAKRRSESLAAPGEAFAGDWRGQVLKPIFEEVGRRLEADLLLGRVWEALGDDEREHLGRASVASAPVPWEAILELEPAPETGRALVEAGLLSPFRIEDDYWWAPHRLVSETVADRWLGDSLVAHRRLGEWFEGRFEDGRKVLWAQRAVEHLCAAGEADRAWPPAERLAIHLRGLGRYREALEWVERVMAAGPSGPRRGMALYFEVQLARYLGELVAGSEAKLNDAMELVEAKQRGSIFNELGNFYRQIGRLSEAAESFLKAIEVKVANQGEQSNDVAVSLHSLASVLEAQGDLSGAREHLERCLAIKSAVFGTEEHPEVAASLHELAGVLKAQGDLSGAREHLERCLAIQSAVFGTEEHPSVASSLHELAGVLQAQGDLSGAREHLERCLAISAAVFGTEEHPSVAASLHSLAGVLKAQGDLSGAREHLERCLAIQSAVFGTEEHPSVASSLHSLAGVLQAQGDLSGAREHLERCLAIKSAVFGTEEHPDVAASLHSLAGVLQAQGDLSGAREHLERCLAIQSAVFGTEEHPDVAASLHSLAGVLQAQGDLSGAREKLELVLEIEARVYGTREHYSTAITEMNLGGLLFELGEQKEAVEFLAHAYAVFRAQLGPDHPYTQQLAPLFEQKKDRDVES